MDPRPDDDLPPALAASLCATCARRRVVRSARGSVFLHCSRSAEDPRFPKYPAQPVRTCSGFEA